MGWILYDGKRDIDFYAEPIFTEEMEQFVKDIFNKSSMIEDGMTFFPTNEQDFLALHTFRILSSLLCARMNLRHFKKF